MDNDFIHYMIDNRDRLAGNSPKDNPWVIKYKGAIIERADSQESAMRKLTKIQPHSIWEATRKDGYEIKNEPVNDSAKVKINEKRTNFWDVFLNGEKIDTVTDVSDDPEDVKRSLIDHDGYDPNITVKINRGTNVQHKSPNESTVTGALKLLKSLKEAKIDSFYVVTQPTKESTREDICFNVTPREFMLQAKGGLHSADLVAVYDNAAEALEVAEKLLKDVQNEAKVPDDADPEDTKINKLIEQDEDEKPNEGDEKDLKIDQPEDPANPKPEGSEEDEAGDTVTKEYIGKTEDTHYYMVGTPGETEDTPADLQILDQEGKKVFSASEQEMDVSNPAEFIIAAIQELEIDEITRSVLIKHILPKFEEEDEEENPDVLDDENPEEDSAKPGAEPDSMKPQEELPNESKKVNEAEGRNATREEADDYFRNELIKHLERMGDRITPEEKELLVKAKKAHELNKFTPAGAPKDMTIESKNEPDVDEKRKLPDALKKNMFKKGKKANKVHESGHRGPDRYVAQDGKELVYDYDSAGNFTLEEAGKICLSHEHSSISPDASGKWLVIVNPTTHVGNEGKVPDDADPEDTKINKLIETNVQMGDDTFEVEQVDDGTLDTVININGQEYRFDKDFADMWRDTATGELSKDGLHELALDALSNMTDEEYAQVIAAGDERSEDQIDTDEDQRVRDVKADNDYDSREEEKIGESKKVESVFVYTVKNSPREREKWFVGGDDGEESFKLKGPFNSSAEAESVARKEAELNDADYDGIKESLIHEKGAACTKKEKRQVKHIEKAEKKTGKPAKKAVQIAHATVNKQKNEAKVNETKQKSLKDGTLITKDEMGRMDINEWDGGYEKDKWVGLLEADEVILRYFHGSFGGRMSVSLYAAKKDGDGYRITGDLYKRLESSGTSESKVNEREWKSTIDLSFLDPYVNGEEVSDYQELAVKIVGILRAFVEKADEDQKNELNNVIDEFELVGPDDVEEFDYHLNDLYDFGDAHSVWIKTSADPNESKVNERRKLVKESKRINGPKGKRGMDLLKDMLGLIQ